MRKRLIAGNWKMNGALAQITSLIDGIANGLLQINGVSAADVELLVLPPSIYIPFVHEKIKNTAIGLGAQNLYLGDVGAFTGEVSGSMLKEVGCQFVLVGHSERRTLFFEDSAMVGLKFKAAVLAGLMPILCVGETRLEREGGQTEAIIHEQLNAVLQIAGIAAFEKAVIAYEPVWAIGTGLTATPEEAEAVHAFIRQFIHQNNVDLARTIRILYGGSMKPDNAALLLAMPNIDGGLIGGASLDAGQFLKICEAASVVN